MGLDHEIARVARSQHGLITVDQITELGGGRRHLERRSAGGSLQQVNHRVFQVAGVAPTWEARALASVLGAGPGAVASHFTAAALWDLDGFARRGRPELAIPRGRKHRPGDARCHESTDLDRCATVIRSRIPCTDLGRTVLDCGRFLSIQRLDKVVEDARRAHGITVASLIETLYVHARQGRHGIRKLRAVLDRALERSEVTDSELERLVLSLLAERGFPTPYLHHRVEDGGVLIAEVDLAWPDRKVAAELHGGTHREQEVWERDQVKVVELQRLGWTVYPFTWRVYRTQREWMLRRLRAALAD
jgi:hypothetical protein